MSIESVWIAALDKRKDMVVDVEAQVEKYLGLPVNKFWSGNGSDSEIAYDKIDLPDASMYSSYGVGEGRSRHGNAFLSHKRMFTKILAEDHANALCLEEDIYFIQSRFEKIYRHDYVQEFIDAGDWDAIYFGWHQKEYEDDTDELEFVEHEWKKNNFFAILRAMPIYIPISGLHAVLLNKKMMERLTKLECGPMDSYLSKNIERFKLYYIAPKIIGALPSWSNAEGRFQDRSVIQ